MSAKNPIIIVGGGLAGLTLGIGLRQRAIPVTVWEAGTYPRHRVCGEFISGRGQETLARLGLRDLLFERGAISANTTAFFSARAASVVCKLFQPGISISRFVLDRLLAEEFHRLGGELHENERWRETDFPEGALRASGRRVQPVDAGWRWFGLKAHARNVELTADLEMHFSADGYVGMCRLQKSEVNICGLFRRAADATDIPAQWKDALRGAPGSYRHERLRNAVFDEDSFCSVAGLSLAPRRSEAWPECSVGDALTMTPPVTGNGMSMAFESAELAIAPLVEYSEGRTSWTEAKRAIGKNCDAAFARRLRWAGWLQRAMFLPQWQSALVVSVPRWPWAWRLLLEKTR